MIRSMSHRRPRVVLCLAIGAVLTGTTACESEEEPSGIFSIIGTVREQGTNTAISGAAVTVQGKSATTTANGQYSVTGLSAGNNVELRVQHNGHQNFSQNVNIDGEETVNVTMVVPPIMPYVGTWNGSWRNTSSNNTGAARMTVSADTIAQTSTVGLDLDGTVFGFPDPPLLTNTAPYATSGNTTLSIPIPGVGTLNAIISPTGQISGTATPIPGFFISRIDFTGTATPSAIAINLTLTFAAGGTNQAVFNLTK